MFSDAELSVISNTFSGDGEDSLYLIRNVLLQFPLTVDEKKKLKGIMTPAVYDVVKKKILPSFDPDAPLGQLGDLNQSLTADLKTKSVDEMEVLFDAKRLEIAYLTQQFEYLKDIEIEYSPEIILSDMASLTGSPKTVFVHNTARNFLAGYVDTFLIQLKTIAGTKDETPEQKLKRLSRDSSK